MLHHAGTLLPDDAMQSNDQLAIFLEQPVSGNATLLLNFSYPLAPGDTGFHLTNYTATDGSELMFGATQMQARPSCASHHLLLQRYLSQQCL